MGKIDTTAIAGFEGMSAEEQVQALLGYDVPDVSDTVESSKYNKLKTAFDKTSSEMATLKKQLAERLTDEEKAKADSDAAHKELQDKYDALLRDSTITRYVAKYVAMGYPEDLAAKTAEALFSGDTDTVFKSGEAYRDLIAKNAKADALKDTPRPPAGDKDDGKNKLSPGESLASQIGKQTAAANKVTTDVMSHYL